MQSRKKEEKHPRRSGIGPGESSTCLCPLGPMEGSFLLEASFGSHSCLRGSQVRCFSLQTWVRVQGVKCVLASDGCRALPVPFSDGVYKLIWRIRYTCAVPFYAVTGCCWFMDPRFCIITKALGTHFLTGE